MPNVRATCLLCEHPVEVPAGEVVLHVHGTDAGAASRYGFRCPECGVFVVRHANEAIVDALVRTAGVRLATGTPPPWEAEERPGVMLVDAGTPTEHTATSHAPPITEADVLLFRRALDDDAIMAAWLSE